MADIALLGLGRDGRLRSRIIRAESETKYWAVEVGKQGEAVFYVFRPRSGPFPPGQPDTEIVDLHSVKNVGSTPAKITISFDRYNPETGAWETVCQRTTDFDVGVGECVDIDYYESTGECSIHHDPTCEGGGRILITTPSTPGTYYYGMRCWAENEAEPEYPSPTAAGALLAVEGEELPAGAARPPPCDSYGDTDGDGYIRPGIDAVLVQAYIVGGWEMVQSKAEELGVELKIDEDEFARRADVNGDGAISIRDAQLIDKYANGITPTFPVCVPQEKPLSLECLFPRLVGGELFPRTSCFLEGENFISCLFPRVYCLMTMTR